MFMESLFMPREKCQSTLSPSLPHYCPTPSKSLTRREKNICIAAGRIHSNMEGGSAGGCHGNETTPTTRWSLQLGLNDGGREEEEEGEGEVGSDSSSHYNELWQSTSTVDTTREREEGGVECEGVTVGGWEGEREEKAGSDEVDGATGQSTIAKYIERFRKAPPTPREGRGREDQAGPDREFWWQQQSPRSPSGGPSPNSDPSPARSNSTPDSASTPESTLAQLGILRGRSGAGKGEVERLEQRAQQALLRSSSLLDTTPDPVDVSLKPHPPRPRPLHLAPPTTPLPGGAGDILQQWRLQRRMEQAHGASSLLTSRLGQDGRPMFKSRAWSGFGDPLTCSGNTAGGGGRAGDNEMGETGGGRVGSCQTRSAPTYEATQPSKGRAPVLPHPRLSVNTSCASPSTPHIHHAPLSTQHHHPPSPVHSACVFNSHCCPLAPLPPHRHTVCDIVPCTLPSCHHHRPSCPKLTVRGREKREVRKEVRTKGGETEVPGDGRETEVPGDGRETEVPGDHRKKGISGDREKKAISGDGREKEKKERERDEREGEEGGFEEDEDTLTQEQRVSSSLCLPSKEMGHLRPAHTSSPTRPPVRYPSAPSVLDHMRCPCQSHDNHTPTWSPGEELSSTASGTFLSTTVSSTPNHTPSPPGNTEKLLTQTLQQYLFHDRAALNQTDSLPDSEEEDYEEHTTDPLLSALLSRARALKEQLRKIHSLLSGEGGR